MERERPSPIETDAARPVGETRYFNRELTWLDFNARVIALAEDDALPVLERVKFLAIASRNLDHFFQVRVAGLKTQIAAEVGALSIDGRSPAEQLTAIHPLVIGQVARLDDILHKDLLPRLRDLGIWLSSWDDLAPAQQRELSHMFAARIFPVLTPLSVDPSHPFPYISNLSLNLAVVVRDPDTQVHRFARIKVPPLFARWIALPDGAGFLPIDQLIAAHAQQLFPGMEIVSCNPFRVTRDADLALDETDAEDLLQAVEFGLKRRLRMNAAVRLEVTEHMSERVRSLLLAELELSNDDLYVARELLDPGSLWEIHALDRSDAKLPPHVSVTPPAFAAGADGSADLFAAISEQDVLVQHPYESFGDSTEAFLAQAADDPAVLAIKHTLYRTSGVENTLVRNLIEAAAAGKQVVTLVELTARFDEQANIKLAQVLEEAGVHVVYGVVGLKSHCKVTLVVRAEADGIRRYVHIGTGNYHPQTARSYEDLGLFSCSDALAADAAELFNYLTGCSKQTTYRKLLVAPRSLRGRLLEEIERERKLARVGRIAIKVNGLADGQLIDALYEASREGVEIDLIVRGVCCLRPGVPGLSETIRVRSIVGPFLEHSRIYRFGRGGDARHYIGSADLMPRNLEGRVEVVVPVEASPLAARIDEILELCLADDVLAWQLDAAGAWHRAPRRESLAAQEELVRRAAARGGSAVD
ncbi:MAG: polyphosphate kinase 1 [Deltaproteobacteria bacterium]|nr:MAG: polyphosphate kinase 1 [Deltaproteobacteria bacterium]